MLFISMYIKHIRTNRLSLTFIILENMSHLNPIFSFLRPFRIKFSCSDFWDEVEMPCIWTEWLDLVGWYFHHFSFFLSWTMEKELLIFIPLCHEEVTKVLGAEYFIEGKEEIGKRSVQMKWLEAWRRVEWAEVLSKNYYYTFSNWYWFS